MSLAQARVGDEIAILQLPPLTLEMLQAYADASGDHAAVHLDDAEAKAFGFPSPIAHGLLVMAWMGRAVTDWASPRTLRAFNVRFVAPVVLGEALSCSGVVEAVEAGQAHLQLKVVDQAGALKLDGKAVVAVG